eukprot:m.46655 g.46655  ORF g.46655 m.46655 type:complete len:442 (+) comp15177_c0_seq1:832-2157(+)
MSEWKGFADSTDVDGEDVIDTGTPIVDTSLYLTNKFSLSPMMVPEMQSTKAAQPIKKALSTVEIENLSRQLSEAYIKEHEITDSDGSKKAVKKIDDARSQLVEVAAVSANWHKGCNETSTVLFSKQPQSTEALLKEFLGEGEKLVVWFESIGTWDTPLPARLKPLLSKGRCLVGLAESRHDGNIVRRLVFLTSEEYGGANGTAHPKEAKFTAKSNTKESFFSLLVGNEVSDVFATLTNEHEVRDQREKVKKPCCGCIKGCCPPKCIPCPSICCCCASSDFNWSYSGDMTSQQLQDKQTKSTKVVNTEPGREAEFVAEKHRFLTFVLNSGDIGSTMLKSNNHYFVLQASPATTSMTLFRFASLCKSPTGAAVDWNTSFKSYSISGGAPRILSLGRFGNEKGCCAALCGSLCCCRMLPQCLDALPCCPDDCFGSWCAVCELSA